MRMLTRSIAVLAILVAADIARAQQQVDIPAEAAGVLQYLEGTWTFTGSIGDEKLSGTFTARWARGRYALITEDSTKAGAATDSILSAGVIGWDPVQEKVTHFGFASDNNVYVNRWDVTAPGEWVGKLTGTREGKEFSDTFKITKDSTKESDRFVITSKDAQGKEAEFVYNKLPVPKQRTKKEQR